MQYTVYYTQHGADAHEVRTEAVGSRDAVKKIKKKMPGVNVLRAEKVSSKA